MTKELSHNNKKLIPQIYHQMPTMYGIFFLMCLVHSNRFKQYIPQVMMATEKYYHIFKY